MKNTIQLLLVPIISLLSFNNAYGKPLTGTVNQGDYIIKNVDGSAVVKNRPEDTYWESAVLYKYSLDNKAEIVIRCQVVNALNSKPYTQRKVWISNWNPHTETRYNTAEIKQEYVPFSDWALFWENAESEQLITYNQEHTWDMKGFNKAWSIAENHCLDGYLRRAEKWNYERPNDPVQTK